MVMVSSNTVCTSLLVVLLALFWPLFQSLREVPISLEASSTSKSDKVYNLIDLKSPAASGPYLKVLNYFVSRSVLSPVLLRKLLNDNGVHRIRQLAAGPFRKLPPTYYPIHKANVTENVKALGQSHNQLLQTGIHFNQDVIQHDTSYHSVMEYHTLYTRRKATPSQVMEQVIVGAEKLDHLHIFSSFRPHDIREQAKQSDHRWKNGTPLSVWDGVPVAIKDMTSVAGHRLCQGSEIKSCVEMDQDDIPARRLREAGAIIVGMTVMTEGGVTPLGYSAHFDGPFNPYSMDHYAGGSSGGSAVAVASGLVPMALGFDGGGSIRIPASMSGTFGLAATYARIPHHDSLGTSMIKAGPLAATLTDVALTHLLLGQPEPGSFLTDLIGEAYLPPPHLEGVVDDNGTPFIPENNRLPLKNVRLGIFWDHFLHTDPEVSHACLEAVRHLESLGAELVNITIPHLRELHLSHGITILSEFALKWDRPFFDPNYSLEANTEITIALGRTVKAAELLSAARLRTFGLETVCNQLFRGLHLDAIVSPMLGDKVPKPRSGYRGYGESDNPKVYKTMRFAPLANLLGLPGLVVPVGYEKDTSLPIGFQLLGDAWSEHKLIRLGIYLEKWVGSGRKRPHKENFFDPLAPWTK